MLFAAMVFGLILLSLAMMETCSILMDVIPNAKLNRTTVASWLINWVQEHHFASLHETSQ
jgi:hypothetical protein